MNHLQFESSPYLLQHAHNPVDWYAWKPEALERARRENKPILVSIGYATCHWCHVMERESFENPDIAAYMNDNFVNIKVDREERPDLDAIYMEACQILSGSGGWPLNCFLTPDGQAFYAGTYFPPGPAFNRPSWLQVLQHMVNIWENDRIKVREQATRLMNAVRRNDDAFVSESAAQAPEMLQGSGRGAQGPFAQASGEIFERMKERFDRQEGGFGDAPKFPSTLALRYLLHFYRYRGNGEALEHAVLSLDKMADGGIYDHLGGGFSRYATDRGWLVPHFEKMLYDNALLVTACADALKALREAPNLKEKYAGSLRRYHEVITDTLGFVGREMTHPEGGFYSALDADSEGVEGKFYVWDKTEIDALLGADAGLFCAFYGASEGGNWEHKNILWRPTTLKNAAAEAGMDASTLHERLGRCRRILFEARTKRIPPGLDDKVLLSWNALMVSAFISAFTATGEEAYREQALRTMEFLLKAFQQGTTSLFHTWKDGKAQYHAMLDDYAFLIAALVDLYQITFNLRFLTLAGKYTEHVLSYFSDASSGLFYYTPSEQDDIVMRKKDLYDSATPSGNSTMVWNLQRLGILFDRREWRQKATEMLLRLLPTVRKYPLSFERWAGGILNEAWPMFEIAVVGRNAFQKSLAIQGLFVPNMVIAASEAESADLPLLEGKTGDDDALIYVCRDFSCQRPVTTLGELRDLVETG